MLAVEREHHEALSGRSCDGRGRPRAAMCRRPSAESLREAATSGSSPGRLPHLRETASRSGEARPFLPLTGRSYFGASAASATGQASRSAPRAPPWCDARATACHAARPAPTAGARHGAPRAVRSATCHEGRAGGRARYIRRSLGSHENAKLLVGQLPELDDAVPYDAELDCAIERECVRPRDVGAEVTKRPRGR